jgi:hypothetical protein
MPYHITSVQLDVSAGLNSPKRMVNLHAEASTAVVLLSGLRVRTTVS